MEDWTNIAKTVSASQDEEVWVEQIFYRDSKHRDEYMEECGNNENIGRLYKQLWISSPRDLVPLWGNSAASGSSLTEIMFQDIDDLNVSRKKLRGERSVARLRYL